MTTITSLLLAAAIALLGYALTTAALSHDRPTTCPNGWKPNTGYLQQPGSCIPQ